MTPTMVVLWLAFCKMKELQQGCSQLTVCCSTSAGFHYVLLAIVDGACDTVSEVSSAGFLQLGPSDEAQLLYL